MMANARSPDGGAAVDSAPGSTLRSYTPSATTSSPASKENWMLAVSEGCVPPLSRASGGTQVTPRAPRCAGTSSPGKRHRSVALVSCGSVEQRMAPLLSRVATFTTDAMRDMA